MQGRATIRRTPIADQHLRIRWNDVDPVRLYDRVALYLNDLHARAAGEQFRQRALVVGIQMLYENEGHSGSGRQMPQ